MAMNVKEAGKFQYGITIEKFTGEDEFVEVPAEIDGVPVIAICDHAFEECTLKSIKLPDTLKKIWDAAFFGCSNLTEIVIPDSVTQIQSYAFCLCENLEKVILPKGIFSIAESTFDRCYSLSEIEIPDTVTSIGKMAFAGCDLTEIRLPNSLETLGENAFYCCSGLQKIVMPRKFFAGEQTIFDGCKSLENIELV